MEASSNSDAEWEFCAWLYDDSASSIKNALQFWRLCDRWLGGVKSAIPTTNTIVFPSAWGPIQVEHWICQADTYM